MKAGKSICVTEIDGIHVRGNDPVLDFAAGELKRYIEQATGIVFPLRPGGNTSPLIRLECSADGERDQYAVGFSEDGTVTLKGKNPRSVLFAVYAFAETCLGFRFFHIGEDTPPEKTVSRLTFRKEISTPAFERRGLILEHVDDFDTATAIIDFVAKNRGNAVFLHFTDVEKCGERIFDEVKKRGLELTVGGHSCARFLSDSNRGASGEPYGDRNQLCYCDPQIKDELNQNIAAYLKGYPGIDRLSLWPSDSKFDCTCSACAKQPFNRRYIQFMDELRVYLRNGGIATRVEHIAYNAGLEASMMRIPAMGKDDGQECDTLFAYWGRDYRSRFDASALATDQGGMDGLRGWVAFRRKPSGRQCTVLEYYNDFWMHTKLFPFLINTIAGDVAFYRETGVDGVLSLIVPPKPHSFPSGGYSFLWVMSVNSRLLLQGLWDGSLDADIFRTDYIAHYYRNRQEAWLITEAIEDILPEVSTFNQPLFRLRLTDIGLVDDLSKPKFSPEPWTPEIEERPIDVKRYMFCKKALARFESVQAVLALSDEEKSPGLNKLVGYFNFLTCSFRSLVAQIDLQNARRETGKPLAPPPAPHRC